MASTQLFRSFRVPYPDYEQGFWGEPTSTLNFCEEDYALSYYCAELCNTITNALFVWLGIKGIRNCIQHQHAAIFLIAYVGYIVVGLGSTAFHATMKYPMQLVDELSMIYTTCLMLYASFSFRRSKAFSVSLGLGLLGLATFITAYYAITQDPAFHQTAYGLLTATVVFRSMWVMESELRPALEARHPGKSKQTLRTMWAMVGTGLTMFLGGYLIWSLDNEFCPQVRGLRRTIELPWAIVFEGHAWWHILTGLGGNLLATFPIPTPILCVLLHHLGHLAPTRSVGAGRRVCATLAASDYLDPGSAARQAAGGQAAVGALQAAVTSQAHTDTNTNNETQLTPYYGGERGDTPSASARCHRVPRDACHSLVREIESQALAAQQQIGLARTQMSSKQREQRLVHLTLSEMAGLDKDAVVYEGVGKMFVSLPVDSLRQKLETQTHDLESEVDKLGQRLLYLETTHKNSREHIDQMLRNKPRCLSLALRRDQPYAHRALLKVRVWARLHGPQSRRFDGPGSSDTLVQANGTGRTTSVYLVLALDTWARARFIVAIEVPAHASSTLRYLATSQPIRYLAIRSTRSSALLGARTRCSVHDPSAPTQISPRAPLPSPLSGPQASPTAVSSHAPSTS
ncbi:hypothetical protein G7046_g8819 [Stylonectria norvegica]|nr:hypothetical protein G7046_g8819 [Stylonectria norvegica]